MGLDPTPTCMHTEVTIGTKANLNMELKDLLEKVSKVKRTGSVPVSQFLDSLTDLGVCTSSPVVEDLLNLSTVYQSKTLSLHVFPSLFLEALSQLLSPNRLSSQESDFWEAMFPSMKRVDFANFSLQFHVYFHSIYSPVQIKRILSLFAGMDTVTFEYFSLFVRTTQGVEAKNTVNEVKKGYSKLLFGVVERAVKAAVGRTVLQAVSKGKKLGPKPLFVRKYQKQAFPAISPLDETTKLHPGSVDSNRTEKLRNSAEIALRKVTCKRLIRNIFHIFTTKTLDLSEFAVEKLKKWRESEVGRRQFRAKRVKMLYLRRIRADLMRVVYIWKGKAGTGWGSVKVNEEVDSPSLCFSGDISWERPRTEREGERTAVMLLTGVLKHHITLSLYHSFRHLSPPSPPPSHLLTRLFTRNSLSSQAFSQWKSLTLAHNFLHNSLSHLQSQLQEQRLLSLISHLYTRNRDKRLGSAWRHWAESTLLTKLTMRAKEGKILKEQLPNLSIPHKKRSKSIQKPAKSQGKSGVKFTKDALQTSIKRIRVSHGLQKLHFLSKVMRRKLTVVEAFRQWSEDSGEVVVISPPRVVVTGKQRRKWGKEELKQAILAVRNRG